MPLDVTVKQRRDQLPLLVSAVIGVLALERLESLIADRRELYNDQVYRINTRISTLPTLILAGTFGWTPRAYFAAEIQETARPEIDPASDR